MNSTGCSGDLRSALGGVLAVIQADAQNGTGV